MPAVHHRHANRTVALAAKGRVEALERQGRQAEAASAMEEYETAWEQADFKPHASCMCAPMAGR
jgi:hypothetical protein